MKKFFLLALLLLLFPLVACESDEDESRDTLSADQEQLDSEVRETSTSCAPLEGIADLADKDRVFDNQEAAVMATWCSEGFFADELIYESLNEELALIREAQPHLAEVVDHQLIEPATEGVWLGLELNDGWTDEQAVADPEVACLTTGLGGSLSTQYLHASFHAPISVGRLIAVYAALPPFKGASPMANVGDGDEVSYDLSSFPHRYIFNHGTGDCPSGCGGSDISYVTVDEAGQVELLGRCTSGYVDEEYQVGSCPPEGWSYRLDCSNPITGW